MTRRRLAALATALCAGLPLAAHADPPGTGIAMVDALVLKACRGAPVVTSWGPYAVRQDGSQYGAGLLYLTALPPRNGTEWFYENSGAVATLSCTGSGEIRVRITDASLPGFPVRQSDYAASFTNTPAPRLAGGVDVPWAGPDALGIRPFGLVTVYVQVDAHAAVGSVTGTTTRCAEFHYVVDAPAGAVVQDQTMRSGQTACTEDLPDIALAAADGAGVNTAVHDVEETWIKEGGPLVSP